MLRIQQRSISTPTPLGELGQFSSSSVWPFIGGMVAYAFFGEVIKKALGIGAHAAHAGLSKVERRLPPRGAREDAAAWGIKFSVPGGKEVWAATNGSGTLDSDRAQRYASPEDAKIAADRISGPRSSIKARVVKIPPPWNYKGMSK